MSTRPPLGSTPPAHPHDRASPAGAASEGQLAPEAASQPSGLQIIEGQEPPHAGRRTPERPRRRPPGRRREGLRETHLWEAP